MFNQSKFDSHINDAENLKSIMIEHPLLHIYGYGRCCTEHKKNCSCYSCTVLIPNDQNIELLKMDVSAFSTASLWILLNLRKTKRVNSKMTASTIKHCAEKCHSPLFHYHRGTIIAAMINCGYRLRIPVSFDPSFNVSELHINEIRKYGCRCND